MQGRRVKSEHMRCASPASPNKAQVAARVMHISSFSVLNFLTHEHQARAQACVEVCEVGERFTLWLQSTHTRQK